MKIKILLVLVACYFSTFLKAALPNWTVNPAGFQYNMTMVAVANINCVELQNPSNRIGVFVGNQCRGTALTNQVANGKYTASLFIYSNVVAGENISFKVYNYLLDSVFNTNLSISFQQNSTFGTSASPFVVMNNNAPTDIAIAAGSFSENLTLNGIIGDLSATDSDSNELFSYALVAGNGSADNAKFSIVGNKLQLAQVVDFESQPSCSLRVRVSDNRGCTFEKNFVLNVLNVNEAPTAILLSDSTIKENNSPLTAFANLSAIDPDGLENFSYTLVAGIGATDNALFNVIGTSLRALQAFNFETKSSYSIRIRVKDNANNVFERPVNILVSDINDVPTNILINGASTSTSFSENRPIGSVAAVLSTVDEDASNVFNYSFVNAGGNDNASFQIVGNQLRTNALFDFETRQIYSVFIQSNDGNGGLVNKQFLLNITDSNDAPLSIGLSANSIAENLPSRTFVAILSTADPDNGQTLFNYSLVAGAGSGGNAGFYISNDSLYSNTSFNYEQAPVQSIRLKSIDQFGASIVQVFQVSILDANDIPTDINISSSAVFENQALNTIVGNLSTIDQDPNNSFIYTLVPGIGSTDNALFNVSGANLRTSKVFDYEAKNTYSIRVKTYDGFGGSFEKVFTINIGNSNDNPSDIAITNSSISENRPINSIIGTFSTSDQDLGDVFTYSFANVAANDNASFVISGNALRTAQNFNYESKAVYYVYVVSSDGNGGEFTKQFLINFSDSNDAPSNISLSSPTISENMPAEFYVGQFTTTDEDAIDSYSYSLVNTIGANDNAYFKIKNDSLFTAQTIDFEIKNNFVVSVKTTDKGSLTYSKNFTIRVINGNDAPTDVQLSNQSFNEGVSFNTVIGTFSSIDPDTGNQFSYSLVSGVGANHNTMFTISGNQLKTFGNFNYELQKQFSIRVQTNDGNGGTFTKVFQINLIDINDQPTNITLSTYTFKENKNINSLIANLSTTDEDTLSTFVYTFSNTQANDNSSFILSGNQLKSNAVFNYESKNVYVIGVQTNDGNGGIFEKQLVVTILDSNDAPINIDLSNQSIAESQSAGSFVAVLSSEDPDVNSTFTYSLVNGNGAIGNATFSLRNDSLFTNANLNFETQPVYTIRVRTLDQGGLSFEKVFSISVIDNNDAPVELHLSENTIAENLPAKSIVGLFSSIDPDAQNNFTYALVAGTGASDNASFSIVGNQLKTNQAFNFEVKNTYSIRVKSSDGKGGVLESVFTIGVSDSNDAPNAINLTNNAIAENRQVGTLIGVFSTKDEDVNDIPSFSLFDGPNNNNNQFLLINNQLRTNAAFNFEDKDFYLIYVHATDQNGIGIVRQFVINIIDSVDAPTAVLLSKSSVNENQPSQTFIGILNAEDPDQIADFKYALVGGAGSSNNAQFSISNDSLFAAAVFNFELKHQYQIRIRATDMTQSFVEQSFSIAIEDAADAPTAIVINNTNVLENASINMLVDTLFTIDEDQNNSFVYALVNGAGANDNASFKIIDNKLFANVSFDFESKNAYTVHVSSQDNSGLKTEKDILIQIVDDNEAPIIDTAIFSMSEMTKVGTVIGSCKANDIDAGQTLSFSLVGTSPYFNVQSNGQVELKSELNYEKVKVIELTVKVEDMQTPSLSSTALITIHVTDEIEANIALPVSNIVTPNADGINDYFTIENVELYKDYTLSIFNANGLEIFKVLSQYDNSWKADYQGSTLPKGTYFYVFKNPKNGSEFKGSINVIN